VVTYDAAQNKPAFQVSDYSSSYVASRGNDNNYDTEARTASARNPWWAVDLGEPTRVYSVDVASTYCMFDFKFVIIYSNNTGCPIALAFARVD